MKTDEPRWWLVPPASGNDLRKLLAMRSLRAFGDGYVSLLLPVYLLALGFTPLQVGAIATATLLGSGAMVFGLGLLAHRLPQRRLALAAAVLMMLSGVAFGLSGQFWPLLLIAIVGTLNPTTGDVTVFSPLEQSMVSQAGSAKDRTAVFARYSLLGALAGASGALFAAAPIVFSFPTGWLNDRVSMKAVMGAALLAMSAAFILPAPPFHKRESRRSHRRSRSRCSLFRGRRFCLLFCPSCRPGCCLVPINHQIHAHIHNCDRSDPTQEARPQA